MYGHEGWDTDSHFLLDGVLHGFKLVDPQSVIAPYSTANYVPAKAMDYIDSLVKGELDTGKLSLVSSAPTCIHALGAVTKKDGGLPPSDRRQQARRAFN